MDKWRLFEASDVGRGGDIVVDRFSPCPELGMGGKVADQDPVYRSFFELYPHPHPSERVGTSALKQVIRSCLSRPSYSVITTSKGAKPPCHFRHQCELHQLPLLGRGVGG